jgi:hypothetical protein
MSIPSKDRFSIFMLYQLCSVYVSTSFDGGGCLLQVLVGESLVKQDDPCAGIAKLFGKDISRKPTESEVTSVA